MMTADLVAAIAMVPTDLPEPVGANHQAAPFMNGGVERSGMGLGCYANKGSEARLQHIQAG